MQLFPSKLLIYFVFLLAFAKNTVFYKAISLQLKGTAPANNLFD